MDTIYRRPGTFKRTYRFNFKENYDISIGSRLSKKSGSWQKKIREFTSELIIF